MAGFACAPLAARGDDLLVPGGRAAASRLLGGVDESAPAAFVPSFNRALLSAVTGDASAAEIVPARRDALVLLRLAYSARQAYGGRLQILPGEKQARERLEGVSGSLGFALVQIEGRFAVDPIPGEDAERRRRAAAALGWDVPSAVDAFNDGTPVSFPVPEERVPSPLPLARWRAIAGAQFDADGALERLATDEQDSLLLGALDRLPPETAAVFSDDDLAVLRREAAQPFFRFAPALLVRGGAVVAPGGEAAEAAWAALVGASPREPAQFLRRLLTARDGRRAYLFAALAAAPPRVVAALRPATSLETLDSAVADAAPLVRFDRARSSAPGLDELLSALAPFADERGLALPGGIAAWRWALPLGRPEPAPRGLAPSDDAAAFVADALRLRVTVRGGPRFAAPRAIRLLALARRAPAVFTAEGLGLLAPAADRFPQALDVVADVAPRDPALAAALLKRFDEIDRLAEGPSKRALTASFDAGLEVLRLVSRAGALPAAARTTALRRWIDAHPAKGEIGATAVWLRDLADALPARGAGAPGRGPRERRLLGALDPDAEPHCFRLDGVSYCAARAETLARATSERLERAGLPSVDALATRDGGGKKRKRAEEAARVSDLLVALVFSHAMGAYAPDSRAEAALFGRYAPTRRLFPGNARGDDSIDNAWRPAGFLPQGDGGPRLYGALADAASPLAPFRLPAPAAGTRAGRRAAIDTARDLFVASRRFSFARCGDDLAAAAGLADDAGRAILAAAAAGDQAAAAFVAARLPAARAARLAAGLDVVSPFERTAIALGALEGDEAGAARPELLGGRRAALEAAKRGRRGALLAALVEALADDGVVDATGDELRPAPFERLAVEGIPDRLSARIAFEARLAVVAELGRRRLPAATGAELFHLTAERIAAFADPADLRDWRAVVRALDGFGGRPFDEVLRECVERRYYRLRDF